MLPRGTLRPHSTRLPRAGRPQRLPLGAGWGNAEKRPRMDESRHRAVFSDIRITRPLLVRGF